MQGRLYAQAFDCDATPISMMPNPARRKNPGPWACGSHSRPDQGFHENGFCKALLLPRPWMPASRVQCGPLAEFQKAGVWNPGCKW